MWKDASHSLTVDATRPANDIAADIQRRIDWVGLEAYHEMYMKEIQQYVDRVERSKKLAESLAAVSGGQLVHSCGDVHHILVTGDWYTMKPEVIIVNNQSICFSIDSTNDHELAAELAAVLGKHQRRTIATHSVSTLSIAQRNRSN